LNSVSLSAVFISILKLFEAIAYNSRICSFVGAALSLKASFSLFNA
jgi:hypothetical protein